VWPSPVAGARHRYWSLYFRLVISGRSVSQHMLVAGGRTRTSPRLVVVDDEATILMLLSGRCVWPVHVVRAGERRGGGTAAASSGPDLVLLDVMMPDGGFEVLRRIRSAGCEVPVNSDRQGRGARRVRGFALGGEHAPSPQPG